METSTLSYIFKVLHFVLFQIHGEGSRRVAEAQVQEKGYHSSKNCVEQDQKSSLRY